MMSWLQQFSGGGPGEQSTDKRGGPLRRLGGENRAQPGRHVARRAYRPATRPRSALLPAREDLALPGESHGSTTDAKALLDRGEGPYRKGTRSRPGPSRSAGRRGVCP